MDSDRYKSVANADAAKKATLLMSGGYKAFLAEVNNLNKRMGDCVTLTVSPVHGPES